MLIDWFTVAAQAINFLILIWLLKRFLYKPVLDAIDARERRIAEQIAAADARMAEARRERDEFQLKNAELAEKRVALLGRMTAEVDVARQGLLEDARRAADALGARRHEALERERRSFGDEVRRRAQDQVFSVARKTLMELADARLEECITRAFTRRVRELNGEAKRELADALLAASPESARVRSAFELPADQQRDIQQTLNETFEADIPVRFEIAPDVIGGIELTSGGRQVAWSIDDYLKSLEKSIGELVTAQASPEAESEPS